MRFLRHRFSSRAIALAALLCSAIDHAAIAAVQTTAFTYQGVLKNAGTPVNASVDLQFKLFDAAAAGNQVGSTLVSAPVAVINGLLSVSVDFGSLAFNGEERWIEIGVCSPPNNGNGPFTPLTPRKKLASAPYAAFALQAALSGTYASALALTNASNQFTGSFTGSGSALTNLNPANLGAGTAGISITGNAANVSGIVAIANGGTGANNATTARTNLGAAATSHTHAAADIAAGNLAIARMPTGGAWPLSTNLNIDANTLVIDQLNNRVGIGEDSPRNALDVKGGVAIGSPFSGLTSSTVPPNGLAVVGDVGIGTIVPDDRLHIWSGASGLSASAGARLIIEDDVDHYINLLAPDTEEVGVLFGNPTNGSAAGGVIFNSPSLANGLQLRTGTNDTHMVITDTGNVGIGTTAPGVKLDVNGTLQADAIELEAPITRYLSFSGAAIGSGGHDGSVGFGTTPGGVDYTSLTNATIAYTPVQLPHGAIVTRVAFTAWDFHAVQDWECELIRQSNSSPSTDAFVLAAMSSSGQTGGAAVVQDSSIANATVNNQNYAYFLRFKSTGTSSPGYIYGATIDYTMIAPFP